MTRLNGLVKPPDWAFALLIGALTHCEKDYRIKTPDVVNLQWKNRGCQPSSGYAQVSENNILIRGGTCEDDARITLLHETTHLVTPGVKHGPYFWMTAFRLYAWAELPLLFSAMREVTMFKRAEAGLKDIVYWKTHQRSVLPKSIRDTSWNWGKTCRCGCSWKRKQ